MQYRAFLSYSHADASWVRWLLRRLETYRVPRRLVGTQGMHGRIGPRLGKFFRDRDELPSAGDLGGTIRAALDDSDNLIVICSPTAAKSQWVNAEIDSFRASGRGDRIHAFIIDGNPASRDPTQDCFPPALLRPEREGDPAHEPLAADGRKEADGRDRAFLKLVAGLLGVGFDQLAQREAQRRHRRLAIFASASFLGMAVAIGLAATAYVARNDAQRRQDQAEDILGFMLGDLRGKLTTVGRLDLMRSVDDKATNYFATLNPRDISDRALEEQARSLTGIGEVRLGEGNHAAATKAFTEALSRTTALYERDTSNGQRLFDLAQAQYWIGFVAYQQGRFDDAERWFVRYRDSALKLAAMDRSNFDWQKEVAYGYSNLAALEKARGNNAEAERAMLAQLALYRQWTSQRPSDLELRFEAADVASWLGSSAMDQGRLKEAENYFTEQRDTIDRNVVADPRNANWKYSSASARMFLVNIQVKQGHGTAAITSIAEAMPTLTELHTQDPSNNLWRTDLASCHWWHAHYLQATDPESADREANNALLLLTQAHATEPENQRVLTWLARSHLQLAQFALGRGQVGGAQAHADAAMALVEPAWSKDHDESLREWMANIHQLQGDVALAAGREAQAQSAWLDTVALLADRKSADITFGRLDTLARALLSLGRSADATPLLQRLESAGYVPLTPWPQPQTPRPVVARQGPP